MSEVFQRVVKPTTSMSVIITYRNHSRLSLMGTGRYGSGQVYEHLTEGKPSLGFTKDDCSRLQQIWERWHLNDMRAGTPKQEDAVRKWRKTATAEELRNFYESACKMLESIDLLIDDGYKYGSAWLKEEVPIDVLKWLFSLPGAGHTFYDINPPKISEQEFYAIIGFQTKGCDEFI